MTEVGMFAKEQYHPRNPINNEEGNVRDGEIWVNLNKSQNNYPYELQKTINELRSQLKRVREDNEGILKVQEEPKNILLSKICNDEKQKNKEHEHNMPKTTPYKHKVRKMEFSSHGDEKSSDESMKNHTKKQQDSS